jgi:hypothetical protein
MEVLLMSIVLLFSASNTVQDLSQEALTPVMVKVPFADNPGMGCAVVMVANVCCHDPVLPVFTESPQ